MDWDARETSADAMRNDHCPASSGETINYATPCLASTTLQSIACWRDGAGKFVSGLLSTSDTTKRCVRCRYSANQKRREEKFASPTPFNPRRLSPLWLPPSFLDPPAR